MSLSILYGTEDRVPVILEIPWVCVSLEMNLEVPHDGLLGEEQWGGEGQELPALEEHGGDGIQLALGQVWHRVCGGGRGGVAQVPGMFTTQQQVLCKTIRTEIMNTGKHLGIKICIWNIEFNKLEYSKTRLQRSACQEQFW